MSDDSSFRIVPGREWLEYLAEQGITPEHLPKIELDSAHVPEQFRHWIPLAERWGIRDDLLRDECVRCASPEEIAMLLTFGEEMDAVSDEWLAGPDAFNPNPTAEYVAFTCLVMAWDMAHLRRSGQ